MADLKKNPLFSVIIPTYNHAQYIKKCLDSVINQTFTDWEAIVVNNDSEDNTVEIVTSLNDHRIKLIHFSKHIIGAVRNEGIRQAEGEWICFLDSDDWWYNDKLERCLIYLHKSDVIFHDVDYFMQNRKVKKRVVNARNLEKDVFSDLMLNANALPNSSVIVRKDLLNKIGYLSEDPELVAVEDFDCWLRLARITNRFTFIPKPLGGYCISAGSISNSEKHIVRETKLFEIHSSFLSLPQQIEAKKRFCYRIARMQQNMGMIDSAVQNYTESIKCHKGLVRLKSIYFLILLFLKKTAKKHIL
jgi:glycosyltransferase involved in cell wall biosynthesis